MPLTQNDKTLTLTVGDASCEIYLYGAHVTSWKTRGSSGGDAEEKLFMSKKAVLDGSAPIRGGIPIAFPIFATDQHPDYPSLGGAHGFARINPWTLIDQTSSSSNQSVTLSLKPDESNQIKSKYGFDHDFSLELKVDLSEQELSTKLTIKNEGQNSFRFNSCFHTYYQIPTSLPDASISPLSSFQYVARLPQHANDGPQKSDDKVKLIQETARCYHLVEGEENRVMVDYGGEREGQGVEVFAKGWKDSILWNPGPTPCTGKIGDLHEGGHEEFICWEPGLISELKTLEGGDLWVGSTRMVAK